MAAFAHIAAPASELAANTHEGRLEEPVATRMIAFSYDHLTLVASYPAPHPHRHLCSHLAVGLAGDIECMAGETALRAPGLFVDSDVEHTICRPPGDGEMLLFLFDETSGLGARVQERYLDGAPVAIAPKELVTRLRELAARCLPDDADGFDRRSLELIRGDTADEGADDTPSDGAQAPSREADPRVSDALAYVESLATIGPATFDDLAERACLSKSRLSHLFAEQMGVSLHRYLAFAKMKKAGRYVAAGHSLTDAALLAGFDSPSHLSSTVQRMFGISLSDVRRSMS